MKINEVQFVERVLSQVENMSDVSTIAKMALIASIRNHNATVTHLDESLFDRIRSCGVDIGRFGYAFTFTTCSFVAMYQLLHWLEVVKLIGQSQDGVSGAELVAKFDKSEDAEMNELQKQLEDKLVEYLGCVFNKSFSKE